MGWFPTLPVTFLVLIILLYYLAKKSPTFQKLKSLFPFLFVLFFLSLASSVLKIDLVKKVVYSEEPVNIVNLIVPFLILIFSVKFLGFLIFDFFFSYKQSIKYPRLIKDLVVIPNQIASKEAVAGYGHAGESLLFTGESTSADVRVSKECKVPWISPDKFRETVKLNKSLALKLSEVIASRKAKRKEFDEKESEVSPLTIKKETESLFLRIKKLFFRLDVETDRKSVV